MMTHKEMAEIAGSITYKPGWEIGLWADTRYRGEHRPYVQIGATTQDSTGDHALVPWKSGKLYLSPHMSRQEIVSAVFGLIADAEMHEAREWFRYKGASIFNPHLDPDVLAEVASKRSSFNVRENAMTMQEIPPPQMTATRLPQDDLR